MSVVETVGVSIIMPFITLASEPSKILANPYSNFFYDYFNFSSTANFMICFGLILVGFYIFRAAYIIIYSYLTNSFSFGVFYMYSCLLFKNYTNLTYVDITNKNISKMTSIVVSESFNLSYYAQNIIIIFIEIFTVTFLYLLLILVNWKMTLILTSSLSIIIFILLFFLKNKIREEGVKRSNIQSNFYKIINETFCNFKMLKFIQNEDQIYNNFSKLSHELSKVHVMNGIMSNIYRPLLETIGFSILILVVVYMLYAYENSDVVLPIVSMYALALYRMLPAINRILAAYNMIMFLTNSFDVIYKELSNVPLVEGDENITFNVKIELKHVNFEYIKGKKIFEDVNLTIMKGDKVAFVGSSGSGKSTLVDIITGLYVPLYGSILVDDIELNYKNVRSFRSRIGYIPQAIYLFDGTVGENVSFGYEYNEEKVVEALKKAKIYNFLLTKKGVNTKVGDGGIQLSGGQKQRIGIARALYNEPDIIVLDEATSALDVDTESKIMDEIYKIGENKTLLIVAHRISTIRKCNKKLELCDGKLRLL
ncbi:ATP-binding cassette domain-containing protein [Campylobacter concisus]|uniref:ATP-binding cassette domain-containing protein n=1 Tax=Campylobacter concisus TaxID=199 RepID=UPI0015E1B124|nr:ATP-binding cassette domain-containing protein [Campylobacter concisus]